MLFMWLARASSQDNGLRVAGLVTQLLTSTRRRFLRNPGGSGKTTYPLSLGSHSVSFQLHAVGQKQVIKTTQIQGEETPGHGSNLDAHQQTNG